MATTSPEPLPVERFAALNAEIDAGLPVREVLEREEITEESWEHTQKHWLSRMAEEAERHRFEVTNRYGTVFKAHRAVTAAKLKMNAPPVAPPDTQGESGPDTDIEPHTAPSRPPPPPSQPSPARSSYPPPRIESRPPPSTPAPSVGAVPVSGVAPPPSTQPAPSTQPTPAGGVAKPDLPFADAPTGPSDSDAPAPTPRMMQPLESGEGEEGGNTMVTAGMKAPSGTLPFQKEKKHAATMVGQVSPAGDALPFKPDANAQRPPSSIPPAPKKKRKFSGTLFAVSPFVSDPLPFGKGEGEGKGQKRSAATVALPPMAPSPQHAMTAAFPLPGAPSEKPHTSLEHFASLCAEIAHDAEHVDEVRSRYGMTHDQHREEATRWRAVFDANPKEAERFTKLVEQYRAYLHARGGG